MRAPWRKRNLLTGWFSELDVLRHMIGFYPVFTDGLAERTLSRSPRATCRSGALRVRLSKFLLWVSVSVLLEGPVILLCGISDRSDAKLGYSMATTWPQNGVAILGGV